MKLFQSFLDDFYGPLNKNVNIQYFLKSFVPPPRLDIVCKNIVENTSKRKVVLVDGHPRTGKTWTALLIAKYLIEHYKFNKNHVFTSGIDSYKILPSFRSSLDDIISNLRVSIESLDSKREIKLLFLDDLLGTNKPYKFNQINPLKIINFFTFDEKNEFLKLLPDDSFLIITSRSLFLFLLESYYRKIKFPTDIVSNDFVSVIPVRWGIFRSLSNYKIIGGHNSSTIESIIDRIEKFHPLRNEKDPSFLFYNSPILAFNEKKVQQFASKKSYSINNVKHLIAKSFFRDDIDTIVEIIKDEKANNNSLDFLNILYDMYFVSIAPSFVFIGKNVFHYLGVDNKNAEKISSKMYYSSKSLKSGRLPNEFYMRAIDENTSKNLSLIVSILEEKICSQKDIKLGLFVRGIIERSFLSEYWDIDESIKTIRPLLDKYFHDNQGNEREKILIHLLIHHHDYEYQNQKDVFSMGPITREHFSPSLASSIGWVLYRVLNKDEHYNLISEEVFAWFRKSLFYQLLHIILNVDIHNATTDKSWITFTAFYSTYLQWALKNKQSSRKRRIQIIDGLCRIANETEKWFLSQACILGDNETIESEIFQYLKKNNIDINTNVLSSVADFNKYIQDVCYVYDFDNISSRLVTVLEDELIWALFDQGNNGENSDEKEILSFEELSEVLFVKELLNQLEKRDTLSEELFLYRNANRYLSLIWHNNWMNTNNKNTEAIKTWVKDFNKIIFINKKLIIQNQLNDNLNYHWFHFVTQRSTWMRDWCFAEDPNKFEADFSQISPGSSANGHSKYLFQLFYLLYQNKLDAQYYKNIKYMFLFIGSRTQTLFKSKNVYYDAFVKDLLSDLSSDRKVLESIIKSIFELSRQGYLEYWSLGTSDNFKDLCIDSIINKDITILPNIWKEYIKEIKTFAYELDLLPDEINGWIDIIPGEFINGAFNRD